MAMQLFEHNQTAYHAAAAMLAETGKAAVIHPTGTGKSFIGFKLCEEHPDCNILWLSPSEYIFRTQLENWAAAGGSAIENITFLTYAKLMLLTEAELAELKPDIEIYDEYHRAGAQCWSAGISRLRTLYPNIPMLGLSATNIRYLDNQRNMADELFDGNVASEMTLGEAIVRGILNPPKYILSVYSYQKDLEKYEKRVGRVKSRALRDTATEYLEALRRAIAKADGLDEIFNKHMENKTGKYIVFCSNFETMTECIGYVPMWFRKVDKNPIIYSVYSGDAGASKAFSDFTTDSDNTHLRLLFCIDALNEGIHLEDISGVILFRPTVSPIVYKQQIGRALSASKKTVPVIFDVVNNIENLYSIDGIKEEMQAAITYYRYNSDGSEIVTEHFQIIDEVADCRKLFDDLEGTLEASWEYMYDEAKAYYLEHGELSFPRSYKAEHGSRLPAWVNLQRNIRSGKVRGNLTEKQIQMLDEIGMRWESTDDLSWNKYFSSYKEYVENGGSLQVANTFVYKGIDLGMWLGRIRGYHKSGIRTNYFTAEREKALEEVGIIWDQIDYLWEQNYAAAMDYYRTHGDLEVPTHTVWNGVKLYNWLSDLRKAYRGYRAGERGAHSSLTEEQIKRLDLIGMRWHSQAELLWEKGFAEAEKYAEQYGAADAPLDYVTPDGYKLGVFLSKCRERYAKGTISQERIDRLNSIKMVWSKSRANDWDACFALVLKYYREHGNSRIPPDYVENKVWLNKWVNEQQQIMRGKRRGKKLTDEQIQKLQSVGITSLPAAEKRWMEKFNELLRFYQQHGHCNIPFNMKCESGESLYQWLSNQLAAYRKKKMSPERIEKFKSIGLIPPESSPIPVTNTIKIAENSSRSSTANG